MFEISTKPVEQMPIRDVVAEYRAVKAELSRPVDSGPQANLLIQRLNELKTRLADELNKNYELGENENG